MELRQDEYRPSSGWGFCSMMVFLGKRVAEPSSDAIQARRAMDSGSSTFDLSTSGSVLRSVPCYVLALTSMQSHLGWRFSFRDISAREVRFS